MISGIHSSEVSEVNTWRLHSVSKACEYVTDVPQFLLTARKICIKYSKILAELR